VIAQMTMGDQTQPNFGFAKIESVGLGACRFTLAAPAENARWCVRAPYAGVTFMVVKESATACLVETRKNGVAVAISNFTVAVLSDEVG
jgi:hypothetical protein